MIELAERSCVEYGTMTYPEIVSDAIKELGMNKSEYADHVIFKMGINELDRFDSMAKYPELITYTISVVKIILNTVKECIQTFDKYMEDGAFELDEYISTISKDPVPVDSLKEFKKLHDEFSALMPSSRKPIHNAYALPFQLYSVVKCLYIVPVTIKAYETYKAVKDEK